MNVKYPHVEIPISELDGNVFVLIGSTTKAMRRGGVSEEEILQFRQSAQNCDSYDEVIQLIMSTVETC